MSICAFCHNVDFASELLYNFINKKYPIAIFNAGGAKRPLGLGIITTITQAADKMLAAFMLYLFYRESWNLWARTFTNFN